MTRKKLFMTVQAVLCAMIAILLAADAIPQTIILNRQGAAVCNAQAPLTHEKPEALYKQALEH